MSKTGWKYIGFLLLPVLIWGSSCNVYKHLPEGAQLYDGAEIKYNNPENIEHPKRLVGELEGSIQPKANRKFLGLFRTRLWFYLKTKEPKKDKGLKNWLKYKIGEAPVYLKEDDVDRSTKLLEDKLNDMGYFRSKVNANIIRKEKEVTVNYKVTSQGRYHIRHIYMPIDTGDIAAILRDHYSELEMSHGEAYSLDNIKTERTKFTNYVRNFGYFDFNVEYLFFYVDTTVGDLEADIYFQVKLPTDSTSHKRYTINDIKVYPVYSIDDDNSMEGDTITKEEYTFIQNYQFIRPSALKKAMLYDKGEWYSQKNHQYTLNHLLDLGTYKFVNIKYDKTPGDSLDVTVYLTPSLTQDIIAEINASTTTSNFLGSNVTFTYTNRNIFKGAETLNLSASGGIETQIGAEDQSFINTLELNGKIELIFPRFLLPFKVKGSTYYVPKTRITITESYQQRLEFFTLNSFGLTYGYDWNSTAQSKHSVTALGVNRIRKINTTERFDTLLQQNPVLRTSFDDVFIINVGYTYSFSNRNTNRPYQNYLYFEGKIDLGGNASYLLARAIKPDHEGLYEITGLPFGQYSRFDGDLRYYVPINKNLSWVSRFLGAIAIPYGNSEVTPYIKQVFGGGSSDLRAYRFRTLGPGSYSGNPDIENAYPDQTGDIKLQLNTELRHTIYSFLKGAVFVDVGNIWLLNEDESRPGGQISKDLWKELAIGAGYGIRLDFNFFVLRLDVAVPLYKPSLAEGTRWAFDEMEWRNKAWRKDNLIFNIAIGYPF